VHTWNFFFPNAGYFCNIQSPNRLKSTQSGHQGDQIGRIFAQWQFFILGNYFENCLRSPHFCASFSPGIDYVLILTKFGLGYILGHFFTNSSGHPAGHPGGSDTYIFVYRVCPDRPGE
jgi:hypothetical protein